MSDTIKPAAPDANHPNLTTDSASHPDGPTPAVNAPQTADRAHGIEVQTVRVRAKGFVHKDGVMMGELANPGDEFTVERIRGAELRANGIVEYADKDAEDAAEKDDPTPDYGDTNPGVVMRRRGKVKL
jgi:hypothetical protein